MRLDPQMRSRLREAARISRVSESEFLRDAIAGRVDAVLGDRLDRRLADVIGVARGGSGHSRRTGRAFTELLAKRRR